MALLRILAGLVASWPQGATSGDVWTATPADGGASVGDTVWLERSVSLPAGWRLRAGRLEGSDEVEALSDPVVVRRGDTWIVRYPVAAWTPGSHRVVLPSMWRLGPDAQADSLPAGEATFVLRSVIPDTVPAPTPRPALAPLRTDRRDPRVPLLAVAGAGIALAAGLWRRRRAPRATPLPAAPVTAPGIADSRWLEAGEPRAVATRATCRLRGALARLVPQAHQGLTTTVCLEVVRQQRPQAPLGDLEAVLGALDRVAFAAAGEEDIVALARRADVLAARLER